MLIRGSRSDWLAVWVAASSLGLGELVHERGRVRRDQAGLSAEQVKALTASGAAMTAEQAAGTVAEGGD